MNRMNSTRLVVEPTADIYARAVLHDVEHGLRKVYETDGTHLRALAQMVERLQSAVEFERASASDANVQLNAMRKERDELSARVAELEEWKREAEKQ